jgi:bifunctional NMN adenylyltransferase/nudix hydrolase
MFDLLVFIGRFQPFHNEHKRVIDTALSKAHNVLVLVGSSGKARTIRNPFTFEERSDMIFEAFSPCDRARMRVKPLRDKTYNDSAWLKQVQDTVTQTAIALNNSSSMNLAGTGRVGLIGASKDNSSYYLKLFPQWESVNVPIEYDVHATEIRDGYFEDEEVSMAPDIPNNVVEWLNDEFRYSEEYKALQREYWFVEKYKKAWEAAPYPVKHLTVDAVVEQSGHILLVKRRSEPGKGLWALPGGHLETNETLEDGVIRELREETGIKVPVPVLRGSIQATHVFDDPYRSNIGRVVTFASYIKLADDTSLPRVRGMDDAEKAKWVPISEIAEDRLFDDHYHIIQYFLGL